MFFLLVGAVALQCFRYVAMLKMKDVWVICYTMIHALCGTNVLASDDTIVAELHSNPPPPCIAKDIEDRSSGIAIYPNGNTREEVRAIMGGIASVFLGSGATRMTPGNIEVVYTAVFFENEPINEVGIYAYKFSNKIDMSMFSPVPELNGKFYVTDGNLLVLLWHEKLEKTARCFYALDNLISSK